MSERITRMTFEQIKKLKGLSDAKKVASMSDEEIDRMINEDPELYHLTDEELSQFELSRNVSND